MRIVAHTCAVLPTAPVRLERARGGVDTLRAMRDADGSFGRFSADAGGPAKVFPCWIAPDGMMLGARAVPIRDPERVQQAFASLPANGHFEWAASHDLACESADGSLGFTVGEARIATPTTEVSYTKSLTVWRREGDGTYRFILDIGSHQPAPATL